MTEGEAKTKWCPFYRYSICERTDGGYTPSDNRFGYVTRGEANTNCIGSQCMAWRWQYPVTHGVTDETAEPIGGYCGLAGKP